MNKSEEAKKMKKADMIWHLEELSKSINGDYYDFNEDDKKDIEEAINQIHRVVKRAFDRRLDNSIVVKNA